MASTLNGFSILIIFVESVLVAIGREIDTKHYVCFWDEQSSSCISERGLTVQDVFVPVLPLFNHS